MTAMSELNARRMLALTKAALLGTIPDENLFLNIGETEWNELFEQSAVQGVMVLSFTGAMRLAKELQPPPALKLRWIASVETVEKRYRHRLETAKKLAAYFKENNIQMLLFKGIALSRLYPEPSSREFGDIDIFLCGKATEGDALLQRFTDRSCHSSEKHVNFSYKGILIENHHTFLNHAGYKSFHRSEDLEKRLMTALTDADRVEDTLLFPPPDFDALFVTLHMLAHLPNKIVLRHLCDLAVLFTAYQGRIDFPVYRNTLSEAGLTKLADALISLAIRYLGLNPEYAPPHESDVALEDRIWNDMLNPLRPKKKSNLIAVFQYKTRLLWTNRWKYELVFPGKFWKRNLHSAFFHILHPGVIGKL